MDNDAFELMIVKYGICGIFILLLVIRSVSFIGAGEVGVPFDPLADGVQTGEFTEGLNFKAPWVSIDTYNIKTQDYTMSRVIDEGAEERDDRIRTVTSEGLYVDLDVTVLYRIDPTKADEIRKNVGRDGQYQSIVVRPTIRTAVRESVSTYVAMDIYGDRRKEVETAIHDKITAQLDKRHILIERVLLRDVELPEELTRAIELKKAAEQEALKMEYILQKETLEKERKIIEAEGIFEANKIIDESLTKEWLTYYWILNLKEHESVLYVPVGDGGMPLLKEVGQSAKQS